jgi:hypothetical protein
LFEYRFTPTTRETQTHEILVSLTNGSTDGANRPQDIPVTLSGKGVGPEFAHEFEPTQDHVTVVGGTVEPLAFPTVGGVPASHTIRILNVSNDGHLQEFNDLTIGETMFGITGPDADRFSLMVHASDGGANGNYVLAGNTQEEYIDFIVGFQPRLDDARTTYDAAIVVHTDQEAEFGNLAEGKTFTLQLRGLEAIPVVPGDYNHNGVVDGADYVVWRRNQGQFVTLNGQDPNGMTPFYVDEEDYEFWRANLGRTAGSGASSGAAAVPEPTTLLLLGVLLILPRQRSQSADRSTIRRSTCVA